MPDLSTDPRDKTLSPHARARRDEMLPALLAEVRRVRRRRTAAKAFAGIAVIVLCSGVLFLATLAPGRPASAPAIANGSVKSGPLISAPSQSVAKVQFVAPSSDILARLAIRQDSPARIEYIDTNQALGILESGGERYGFVEIAGRTEFLLIASK